mmetsp:Transcript_10577/g.17501  ORF Transcript_10577/g.17501 Transcript_10577/m.17501 type:complete len:300 (+) Transcript_10577:257-1156(+)
MTPCLVFHFITILLLGQVTAFVIPPVSNGGRTFSVPVSTNVAGLNPDDNNSRADNNSSPSTAFGSPLSQQVIDFNKSFVGILKTGFFDNVFAGEERDFARFYALETIARVPYFSYLAALHFYETIGRWRKAKYLRLHFAESWNELHHLLIMEELGGADAWFDRFIAQHIAVGYYVFALSLYFVNPVLAYNLNHAIEEHAYSTYDTFLKENEEKLKGMAAPQVAIDYYRDGDLYMFDAFQISNTACLPRRPEINNLYDVFCAVREDELEHVKTMEFLQTDAELISSHDEPCDVPDEIYFS